MKGNPMTDAWYEHGAEWRDRVPAQQLVKGQKDVMPAVLTALAVSYV